MPLPFSNKDVPFLRFGVFEADLAAGELRKNGVRIRLQEQPFQVLGTLLRNSGQVVTRDYLRETIWPADTFVDFDHSLNTAVNKIREALGDSASSPRFVETLARRGYRFIAPVESFATTSVSGLVHAEAQHKAESEGEYTAPAQPAGEAALHPDLHVPIPRRGVVRALFALIQVMYLIFYVSGLAHLRGVDAVVRHERGIGDRRGRNPAEILFALRGRFRLPPPGRNFRAAVSVCFRARRSLGHRAVPAVAADRHRLRIRGDGRVALRTFFRENAGADGLLSAR
jgi:DNA-binding winged helix-turn-helix (wHTH) protein